MKAISRVMHPYLILIVLLGSRHLVWAQQPDSQNSKPAPVQAVKQVTGTRESLAITYPEGVTLSVKLQGTQRLPYAKGEAKVQRKRGATEIEIELDEMKSA